MPNEEKKRPTHLSSTAKKAQVIRALPGGKFALSDGTIADKGPGVTGVYLGASVIYVRGGPGIHTGFVRIIGLA